MSLIFDGNGYIQLASNWVTTDADNWEVTVEVICPLSGNVNLTTEGDLFGFYVADGSTTVVVRYKNSGSGTSTKSLTTAVDLRDGEIHTIRISVTGTTLSLFVDGAVVADSTADVGGTYPMVPYEVVGLGHASRSAASNFGPTVANTHIYSITLTDLTTPDNSSSYLLDEGVGLIVGDSGVPSNDGTLTSFTDANAAWVSGAPTATLDITVNNPYIYTAPVVTTDSNSIFNGQFYSAGSRHYVEFTGVNADKITYDFAAVESGGLWANDVNDWITADAGFSGDVDITLHVWDANTSTVASVSGTVTVTAAGAPDTEKPVITPIGSTIINHPINTPYVDEGANVTDNVDADAVLVAAGSVNTTVEGNNTLAYDYTDAAGNVADTAYRYVNVFDPDAITESAGFRFETLQFK